MIRTTRLELIPAGPEALRAALRGRGVLAAALGLHVPDSWPPDLLDDGALRFTLERLAECPHDADWWMYFAVARNTRGGTLIGTGGFRGPPVDGVVEIGYSVVSDHRRRGYATELVAGLLGHAFSHTDVRTVVADTLPALFPSIAVLAKSGFRFAGPGPDPGTIRFACRPETHARGPGADAASADLAVVHTFIERFGAGDVRGLLPLLTDDLEVEGPWLRTTNRAAYLEALGHDPPTPAAARVHTVISDGPTVFVAWEYVKPEGRVAVAQQFVLRHGRIRRMLLLFDPAGRPTS